MSGGIAPFLYDLSVWVIPILVAVTFHEAAHGFVAWILGDDTAHRHGRVTFNPIRHVDPIGTVVLPGLLLLLRAPFLFGYAKPVPVDFRRLRNPRRDMVLVALAGPGTNLGLAVLSALAMHGVAALPDGLGVWVFANLHGSLVINLVLAVFNMIPLPPLDGGRVAVGLLPTNIGRPLARLERHGFMILLGLLFIPPLIGDRLGVNLNLFPVVVGEPVAFLYDAVVALTGLGG